MLKRIFILGSGIVAGATLAVGAAHFASLWGLLPDSELNRSAAAVKEVMQLVNENYVDSGHAGLPTLTRAALEGMVKTLDPHSEYMPAAEYKALEDDLNSEFGGIGLQVDLPKDVGRIVVVAPLAGSPSDRAGILAGDQIVSINGERLLQPAMRDVVDRLRGKPGTTVVVGLFRPATRRELSFTLVREKIRVESVRNVHLLPGGVGYVNLTEFGERTATEFAAALANLQRQGMKSLVIDLRDNPGGLLDTAVAVAGPFFKKGEMVLYTMGRDPKERETFRSEADGPQFTLPTAVLINADSASAAEILAGALKDTHRAVIVGERSFGKGSVQTIFPLANGDGLRLTIAKYYTPGGEVIHGHGITPDVEVVLTAQEDLNLAMQRERPDVTDPKAFEERFGVKPVADRQLDAAVAVLEAGALYDSRVADKP
jgi:carboxyl-terminal processing protease